MGRRKAMSKEAISVEDTLKLAYEALNYIDDNYMSLPKVGNEAIKSLEAALEAHKALASEQEQRSVSEHTGEPVAWALGNNIESDYVFTKETPLYTTPYVPTGRQQRTWVGLTDEQKLDLVTNWFAELWAIEKAMGLLDDYEAAHGIKE